MQSPAFSIEGLLADISNVSVDGGVQVCMLGIQGKCHHHILTSCTLSLAYHWCTR